MKKRQIKMQDGRYLIFYTFEDAPPAGEHEPVGEGAKERPLAKPEAEEER